MKVIWNRLRKNIGKFMKFGIVGVSNTMISLGCYYLLVWLGVNYLLANAAGFVLSVMNSYFWNSRYVFTDKTEKSRVRAFVKVFLSYGISFCLSSVLMFLFVQVLSVSPYVAPVLRLIFTIPLNYMMNKCWAFKER